MTAASFQRDFVSALFDGEDGGSQALAALVAQPGFSVYRNTVATACIDALAANFPTVRQLVGDDWFRAAAAVHARATPPRDGRMVLYGADFADFLAAFAPARDLPYLSEVARWDRRWTEAHAAGDAPVLDAASLAALDPAALAEARLALHPAARWAWCDGQPAFTIWRRHREGDPPGAELAWRGDGGLVARPADAVVWRPLAAAEVAFLDACAVGLPFAEAAEPLGDAVAVTLPALLAIGTFAALTKDRP